MLPTKIHLEIVTPYRRVVERDVDEVILPGSEGMFGVLPGHAPMLAGLQAGVATCRAGGATETLALSGGFAEVTGERVTVMAETCELASEIDVDRAKKKADALREEMKNPEADIELTRLRMMKHLARIEAGGGKFL